MNKVNSKAILKWKFERSSSLSAPVKSRLRQKAKNKINQEDELVVQSDRFRDQGRNVSDCLEKLRKLVASVATPPKKRKKTKPNAAAKKKRLDQKKKQSEKKSRRRFDY